LEQQLPDLLNAEHPNFQRFKTIKRKDLVERAKFKTYLTEEEATWKGLRKMVEDGEQEKLTEILAKCLVEQLNQYEIPLQREKKNQSRDYTDEIMGSADCVFWLKDFPSCPEELAVVNQ
jgi:hypothetical protein